MCNDIPVFAMLFIIHKTMKNIVNIYNMTIYVDKIVMGFDNEYYSFAYDRQYIRRKEFKTLTCYKRYEHNKNRKE